MKAGARINAGDVIGWQPIHFAAHNGHVAVIKELLLQRASVEVANGGDNLDLVHDFMCNSPRKGSIAVQPKKR